MTMTDLRAYPPLDAPQIGSWRAILCVFVVLVLILGSVSAAGWESQFDHPILTSGVVVAPTDSEGKRQPELIVVGDQEGFVRAFDTSSGEVIWETSLGGALGSAPAFHETWGTVVFVLKSGSVRALSANDGRERWRRDLDEPVSAAPTITRNGRVVVGSRSGELFALEGETGAVMWSRRLRAPILHPAVATRDSTLIVTIQKTDRSLVFLDAATGAEAPPPPDWPVDFGVLPSSAPAVDDAERVFVAHSGGKFVAVLPIGTRIDTDITGRPAGIALTPTGTAAWIASTLRSGNHEVRRIDASFLSESDPSPELAIEGSGPVDVAPIIGSDGEAYVASRKGQLTRIDSEGHVKELFRTPSGVEFRAAPVRNEEGVVFIGDTSGTFRALETGATGAWPTAGNNPQRTGQAGGSYHLPGEVVDEWACKPDDPSPWEPFDGEDGPSVEVKFLENNQCKAVALRSGLVRCTVRTGDVETRIGDEMCTDGPVQRVVTVPVQRFLVSEEVPVPLNADVSLTGPEGPKVYAAGGNDDGSEVPALLWHWDRETLHAVVPGAWRVEWKTAYGTTFHVDIQIEWPGDASLVQRHVAGSPAVRLRGASGYDHAFLGWQEGCKQEEESASEPTRSKFPSLPKVGFECDVSGRSVLIVGDTPNPSSGARQAFILVETVDWDDPNVFEGEHTTTIGSAIDYEAHFPALHQEDGRSPYVLKEKARVNVHIDGGYYDRAERTGPIIPVNEDDPLDPEDDLILAFYQGAPTLLRTGGDETISAFPGWRDEKRFFGTRRRSRPEASTTGLFWPVATALYRAQWPQVVADGDDADAVPGFDPVSRPELLVIAAQTARPFQLDERLYHEPFVYRQDEPDEPGYNPNEEHAFIEDGTLWVVRSDLNAPTTSKPFVLLGYRDPDDSQPKMKVVKVTEEDANNEFVFQATAGQRITPPSPLHLLSLEETVLDGRAMLDRKGQLHADRAGDTGDPLNVTVRYCYRKRSSFDITENASRPSVCEGEAMLPWLAVHAARKRLVSSASDGDAERAEPIDVEYVVRWPADAPVLRLGETLTTSRPGLPGVLRSTSVQIVYQQSQELGQGPSVWLLDALAPRSVSLKKLPEKLEYPRSDGDHGVRYFPELPPHLRHQLHYDENQQKLAFRGHLISADGDVFTKSSDDQQGGGPFVLLNVLTKRDAARIRNTFRDVLEVDAAFDAALRELESLASEPKYMTNPDDPAVGYAVSTAEHGATGYVTVALNNSEVLNEETEPVQVEVFRVAGPYDTGRPIVIEHSNPFSEEVYVRHSGDFAGQSDQYEFDWRISSAGQDDRAPEPNENWEELRVLDANDPDHEARIVKGSRQLSKQYVIVRYRRSGSAGSEGPWTEWTDPKHGLVEGWMTRVADGLSPFDQQISNFRDSPPNTVVSMLEQAGPPYLGPVVLNVNRAGRLKLLETYETVYRRGKALSIDGSPARNDPGVNRQLQRFAGVLSDLYFLLANEAHSDAIDPTILIPSGNPPGGPMDIGDAHAFKGLTASLLDEELALLRGVNDSNVHEPPVFNRLHWNLTGDNLIQPIYVLNYGISEDNVGTLGEDSPEARAEPRKITDIAKKRFPQGHGDAYGHYLSALKVFYGLFRDEEFDWTVGSSVTAIGSDAVEVDYFDERRFAQAALGRARAGLLATHLTYRKDFSHESPVPLRQVEVVEEGDGPPVIPLSWGVSDWASRVGQGAYLDWVVGNALVPKDSPAGENSGIARINRSTVPEFDELTEVGTEIQAQMDQALAGVNPLGVPRWVVPFDVDVSAQLTNQRTAFDILLDRVTRSVRNARYSLEAAMRYKRGIADGRNEANLLNRQFKDRESSLNSRLIELFGTPFPSDIGPEKAYETGYRGPDVHFFRKHRCSDLLRAAENWESELSVRLPRLTKSGDLSHEGGAVETFEMTKESTECIEQDSKEQRESPGALQFQRRELVLAANSLHRVIEDYDAHIHAIREQQELMRLEDGVDADEIEILEDEKDRWSSLDKRFRVANLARNALMHGVSMVRGMASATAQMLPTVTGLSTDFTSVARAGFVASGEAKAAILFASAEQAGLLASDAQRAKQLLGMETSLQRVRLRREVSNKQRVNRLRALIRQEASLRNALYTRYEAMRQALDTYRATLAKARRLLTERHRLRSMMAGDVRQLRYRDLAYRLFRSEASGRYSGLFDKALTDAYVLARVFDYSTNFADGDVRARAPEFYDRILRARTLGRLATDGSPVVEAEESLATILGRMKNAYEDFRELGAARIGGTEILSIRRGLFRLGTRSGTDAERSRTDRDPELLRVREVWRSNLRSHLVSSLGEIPELRSCCIDVPEGSALVIPFQTPLVVGANQFNHFGFPKGAGDSGFNGSLIDSKLTSVRVIFDGYGQSGLAQDPAVFLVPLGQDDFRSPARQDVDNPPIEVRSWLLATYRPPPHTDLRAFRTSPSVSSAPWTSFRRRHRPFDATFGDYQNKPEQRNRITKQHFGRSVYNTRWLLVVPARNLSSVLEDDEIWGHFLGDPNSIKGVTDIRIEFAFSSREGA